MSEKNEHRIVAIHRAVLAKNEDLAACNRALFQEKGIRVLNLLSSPGSGKTTLLERTLIDLAPHVRMGVIVGDLATDNDARRMNGTGAPVVQITTGDICHLEAAMVAEALKRLDLSTLNILFIENVGNLVCPVSYDLGEEARVVLMSVTEGEDKPLKYPTMFKAADVVIITKTDIAEAVGFQRETALQNIRRVAPQARVMEVSARTGAGMEAWYDYLRSHL